MKKNFNIIIFTFLFFLCIPFEKVGAANCETYNDGSCVTEEYCDSQHPNYTWIVDAEHFCLQLTPSITVGCCYNPASVSGKCDNNKLEEWGFCVPWLDTACAKQDPPLEPRFSSVTGGKAVGCSWWNNTCCYLKNGLSWNAGKTCLGEAGCVPNAADCETPFTYSSVVNWIVDTCDSIPGMPLGYFCCEKEFQKTKLYAEECLYHDVTAGRNVAGRCITDPSACAVPGGSGNCKNNYICCPELSTSCVSDLGGECIGVSQVCVGGVREMNTDCINNSATPSCCLKNIDCETAGYECTHGGCSNRISGLKCTGPGNVCCADGHDCIPSGGSCIRSFCDSANLLFPVANFDPCWLRDNISRCCYGTYETCDSQGGINDPVCIDGIHIPSSDVPNCCLKYIYNFEPIKPKDLVYRGPVIEKLEDILGPVTKMLYYGGLGIGVFYIILSGYKLMVSEGDPQRTKAAQEQLTSAIVGIIFILLSVTIIRVIIDEIIKM